MKYVVKDKRTNQYLGDITLSHSNIEAAKSAARLNWPERTLFVREIR